MPAWLLWDRVARTAKKLREEGLEDHKRFVLRELMSARAISFGLQANGDPPPSWQDIQNQKKNKPPQKGQVEKARKAWTEFVERHQQGLSSPYHFEEYMGLASADGKGHVFEPPPPESVTTSKEFRAERKKKVSAMEQRIVAKLDQMIEKHGESASFDDIFGAN